MIYLRSQIVVALFLAGLKGVPPLAEDFADSAVVLVGVSLVNHGAVTLAEDHEGVHWASDVVLVLLWE